jgi:hypothetical protein
VQLERTGPFVPPITFPVIADVIVTDTIRSELEADALTGCSFAPVDLARIVQLDWREWDTKVDIPLYPEDRKPESMILDQPHDRVLAAATEPMWEMIPERWGTSSRAPVSRKPLRYRINLAPDPERTMPDVFRAAGTSYTFVSNRAAEWFNRRLGDWIELERVADGGDAQE